MIPKKIYPVGKAPLQKPTKHGMVWTVEDYAKLIDLYIGGADSVTIGEAIGRMPRVVVSVLVSLGLVYRSESDFYNHMRSELKFVQDLEDIATVSIPTQRSVTLEDMPKLSRYYVMGMPMSRLSAKFTTSKLATMRALEKLGYVHVDEAGEWQHSYKPLLAYKPASKPHDDTAQGSVIESPTPCSSTQTVKEEIMIAIENRTYINDTNAADMTDDQVFNKIAELERDMAKLEAIKNKPKKMVKRIEEMQEAITKLVAYVDERP